MCPFMEELPLYRVEILCSHLLDVDKRTLPFAEEEVLERLKRQEILVGMHTGLPDVT